MVKVFCGLLGTLPLSLAHALTETEAPMEQVSPATVFVFLALVVAIIVGFFWWNARRGRRSEEQAKTRH
jgi:hypothetical protein